MTEPLSLSHYGIKEWTSLADDIDAAVEEIRILGFCVLENVLSPAQLEQYRMRLDAVYATQIDEVGCEENLHRISDANIVRMPLVYDETFLELACLPQLHEIARRLLGDYYILQLQNGVVNQPGVKNYQAAWHRDLNYQHYVSSRPLAFSALVCLDPFNAETGGTRVLPGTHKIEPFPSETFVQKYQQGVTAEAGSVLVFDAMLYHCAGQNRSSNLRRAVNHVFALPCFKQQLDLPGMLKGRYAADPFLSRFLGDESAPGHSVSQWRHKRLSRLEAPVAIT